MMETVAQLRATRRYLTGVLLNLGVDANEITVGLMNCWITFVVIQTITSNL